MAYDSKNVDLSNLIIRPQRKLGEDDSLQFLWAVSYSDLLMVLLSFFIVFFDPNKEESKSRLAVVSRSLEKLKGVAVAKTSVPVSSPSAVAFNGLKEVKLSLDSSRIKYHSFGSNSDSITIDFPDGFYGPGKYEVTREIREKLSEVLSAIQASKSSVRLVFVGHTDSMPLNVLLHKNVLNSNQDLSGIRASRALNFAREMGFAANQLTTEGAGSEIRNTRSLSIRITGGEKP